MRKRRHYLPRMFSNRLPVWADQPPQGHGEKPVVAPPIERQPPLHEVDPVIIHFSDLHIKANEAQAERIVKACAPRAYVPRRYEIDEVADWTEEDFNRAHALAIIGGSKREFISTEK